MRKLASGILICLVTGISHGPPLDYVETSVTILRQNCNLVIAADYLTTNNFSFLFLFLLTAQNNSLNIAARLDLDMRWQSSYSLGKCGRDVKDATYGLLEFVLIILIFVKPVDAAQPCNSSVFCPSSAPFCLSYGINHTLGALRDMQSSRANLFITSDTSSDLSFIEGFCVQCLEDCDCGINQYCGIDPDPGARVTFPGISLSMLPVISATENFTQVSVYHMPCRGTNT